MSREELEKLIGQVQKQMKAAAAELNFEMAAELRDKMITLKKSWMTWKNKKSEIKKKKRA